MSTSLFEFMCFVYGKPIIRLFGAGRADLLGRRARRWIQAFGLSAATSLKRAHSSAIFTLVLVDASRRRRRAARSRTSGTPAPACTMPRLDLGRVVHRQVARRSIAAGSAPSGGLRPVERRAVLAGPPCGCATPRRRRGSPGRASPAWISRGRRLTSVCGLLPPLVVYAVSPGDSAEALGDEQRRVAVAPGQQADDPDRVRLGDRRPARRRRRPSRRPRPSGRRARARRRAVAALVEELAGADDARACGGRGHGRHVRQRQPDESGGPPESGTADVTYTRADARIAIGSDHAGFELKQHLVGVLDRRGPRRRRPRHRQRRSRSTTRRICAAVGRAVRDGDADRGIVLGGSGQGEQIAANKVHGVRAALCNDLYTARLARAHNDANVLSMGARVVGVGLAEEILATSASPRRSRAAATPAASTQIAEHRARGGTDVTDARADLTTDRTPSCSTLIDREVERQNTDAPADRLENFTSPAVLRGRRLGAHQQVHRGLPGQALLRRQRGHRRGRGPGPRPGQGAVRRRARQRAAALGRQRQHGASTWRCSSRATRCWACASTTAATSPTARRSTSAASSTTSSPTA